MRLGGGHLPNGFFGKAKLTKRRSLTVREHQRHDRRRRRRCARHVQLGVLGVGETAEERFLCRGLVEERPKVVVTSRHS